MGFSRRPTYIAVAIAMYVLGCLLRMMARRHVFITGCIGHAKAGSSIMGDNVPFGIRSRINTSTNCLV